MLVGIKEEIAYTIEALVKEFDMSYIDALLSYCEKNGIDEEYVGTIVAKSPNLKYKIEMEAEKLNFIEKTDRLPI